MKRAGIRLFLAACAVLLVGLGTMQASRVAAQDDSQSQWTLDLTALYCPEGWDTSQGFDDCATPDPHLEMKYRPFIEEAQPIFFTTGEGGSVSVELNGVGLGGAIDVTLPVGVNDLIVSCVNSAGAAVDAYIDEFTNVAFAPEAIPAGEVLGCTLYLLQPEGVTVDPDDVLMTAGGTVTLCTESPAGGEMPYWVSPACSAPEGIGFSIADDSGNELLYCIAESADVPDPKAAGCSARILLGSTIVVSLDESTIPDGYHLVSPNPQSFTAPDSRPTGLLSFPFFMLLPDGADAPDDLEEQAESPDAPVMIDDESDTTPAVEGRTVVLYTGDCDNLGEEVATLNDVLPETGDAVGDEKAIPAEMSRTTGGGFFLDQAIDEGMALVVYENETTDTPVACGDLGGANTHDGMLPIGLGEVDDSGIVGTAVLSYNDENELSTDVTIVISAELLPEPTGTPTN